MFLTQILQIKNVIVVIFVQVNSFQSTMKPLGTRVALANELEQLIRLWQSSLFKGYYTRKKVVAKITRNEKKPRLTLIEDVNR